MKSGVCVLGCILMVLCISCSRKKEETKADVRRDIFHVQDTDTVAVKKDTVINPDYIKYKTYVEKLDSADLHSVLLARDRYLMLFRGKNVSLCDSAYSLFQLLFDRVEAMQNYKHRNDTTNYDPLIYNDPVVPSRLKLFRSALQQAGLKIAASDGQVYIEQDKDWIIRCFSPSVSDQMKDFFAELQLESKEGFALNGAIAIPPRHLVERIIWYENFVSENPGFVFTSRCVEYRKAYLTYLLCGYGKTKVMNDKGGFSPYFHTAYSYLRSKYKESGACQLLMPYYDALRMNQFAKAQSLLKDYRIKGQILNLKQ